MRKTYRTRTTNEYGKWQEQAFRIISKVIKIEIQNQWINDKFKTVFYCESKKKPEGRMCVAWGRTTFKVGDEVNMTGRIEGDVFLVWQHYYKSNQPKEPEKAN